ncbi:MAG: HAMP domain-containing histidine kinase [Chloroflexi bacterium]|uniref:sensor histidine kinase n=1 Tax=Candidatus Flexifilum breve TaxID=3140694 RepID=UPI003136C64B|nr:HAMP domain-containing histidine kinase [Chloroflexota bacterium]
MNHQTRTNLLYPLVLLVGMLSALAISLEIVVVNLNPPQSDIQLLLLFMLGSGSVSVASVFLLTKFGLLEQFNSMRWTLLANIILLVTLIILNVWLTAQLMFISEHDFVLTMALLIFAGAISAISVFFIASTWINRIYQLGNAAKLLQSGDLRAKLPVRGRDELAQLTNSFNHMIDGLQAIELQKQELEQTRRDLVAWVSHDLRAPLANIRAMNEAILDGVVSDPQTVHRYIGTVQKELFHLSKMIDDLFDLAQLDAGDFVLHCQPTSLRDMISDALGSMNAKAEGRSVRLDGSLETGIDLVKIAPEKIQRVLHNLLTNALEHTPNGGAISIRARRIPDAVEVSVHNTGSFIPTADLPYVFESFFRSEPSRAQYGGRRGTGLGLAIVRGFVEAHGGQVYVESSREAGTTFRFTIPSPL